MSPGRTASASNSPCWWRVNSRSIVCAWAPISSPSLIAASALGASPMTFRPVRCHAFTRWAIANDLTDTCGADTDSELGFSAGEVVHQVRLPGRQTREQLGRYGRAVQDGFPAGGDEPGLGGEHRFGGVKHLTVDPENTLTVRPDQLRRQRIEGVHGEPHRHSTWSQHQPLHLVDDGLAVFTDGERVGPELPFRFGTDVGRLPRRPLLGDQLQHPLGHLRE